MRQFIPFEDDWDTLERLDPSRLVPYQVGLPCQHGGLAQRTVPTSPSIVSSSPTCTPMRRAVPAGSSST